MAGRNPDGAPASRGIPAGLLVAATRSGAGKTTTTLALLASLRRRGLRVQAAKAGPDFIDPGHHARMTGRPSCNLDTWMGGESSLRRVLARACADGPDMTLVEGVMGLYDGSGDGSGSSADVARVLGLPVLLLLDARGAAQSVAAVAEGFLRHRARGRAGERIPPPHFAGVVCTHVGSEAHAAMLREACADLPVPLLGCLPREGAPRLPSSHLGLVMADELAMSPAMIAGMADWLEAHLDVDALLARIGVAMPCAGGSRPRACAASRSSGRLPDAGASLSAGVASLRDDMISRAVFPVRPRVAVARDEVCCFCYADLPALLAELGAEVVFFSPLRDRALPPDCRAVYLPGGYPELHAADLAGNAAMRESVLRHAACGGRIHGECGGYMLLMRSLTLPDGTRVPLWGCLPQDARLERSRAALGYREVRPWTAPECRSRDAEEGGYAAGSPASAAIWRGHEFHYSRLLPGSLPPECRPLWRVRGRMGAPLPDEGCVRGHVSGSWVHLYPEGSCLFWRQFIHGELPR
ncbi:MAG: cobyrinate a,c-diamide synthase [Desulfovibrionaceae bacterium]|nr:cobyrinate a,c-diamide synthase [Desulfovibrionaceae bacterium]